MKNRFHVGSACMRSGYGELTSWANLWLDEQKPHIRLRMRVRLYNKSKPGNYTELYIINVTDR